MKQLILAALLFCCSVSFAQTNSFPATWTGNWKGKLTWTRTDTSTVTPMELRIQPGDSAGVYTWHIIYGQGNKDSRPYLLKPGKSKSHWVLDELNEIKIDMYYLSQRLSCSFTVGKVTIVNHYWMQGDKLIAEFYTYTADAVSTTGKGTEDVPTVKSYGLRSYQRAELTRN
ncbi:MAG TPA: hypothetical protein VD996_08825 [Chitinophagaceae bacterium]|nr:hypothetical protein [Chitinophagaceae bacterium]